MRRALIALVILGPAIPAHSQSTYQPPIDELILRLQNRYDSVSDFSANFEHRYSGGVLRTSIVEHGTVLVKKPGKMRWHYKSSDEKIYISDGHLFYSFFPVDRQVLVAQIPSDDRSSTSALFLAGKGNLVSDFRAAYTNENESSSNWTIRLTPEDSGANFELLTLTVNRDTLEITGLATEDIQGGSSSYVFTDLVENRGIPDSAFAFTIPDNASVIHQDGVTR